MAVRADYLEANDAFYSTFWRTEPNYSAPFPNAEEAARAGVILRLLAAVGERDGWAAKRPRILDAGCGRGWLTNLLSVFGHAEGCEPVADAVALGRSFFPALTFHALTPGELAGRPGFTPFDVVVSSEVLEHVPSELQGAFVGDLAACLREGGTLVLSTPRGELQGKEDSSHQALEVWLKEPEVEALLAAAGFTALERYRACPAGGALFDKVIRRLPPSIARVFDRSSIRAAVEDRSALYQIWRATRGPSRSAPPRDGTSR